MQRTIQFFIIGILLSAGNVTSQAQDSFKEYIQAGVKAHDAQEYEKAIGFYEKADSIRPSSMVVLYEMGFSYYEYGDYNKAIECFQKAEKASNDSINLVRLYSIWGSALDDAGQSKEALKTLKKGLEYGKDATLLYNIGITAYRIEEDEEAALFFTKALKENPFHANSLRMLASMEEQKGNVADAFLLRCCYLLSAPNGSYVSQVLEKIASKPQKDEKGNITINVNDPIPDAKWQLPVSIILQSEIESEEVEDQKFGNEYIYLKHRFQLILQLMDEFGVEGLVREECKQRYAPMLQSILQKGYNDVFCAIATSSVDPASKLWLQVSQEKVDEFYEWINNSKYVTE